MLDFERLIVFVFIGLVLVLHDLGNGRDGHNVLGEVGQLDVKEVKLYGDEIKEVDKDLRGQVHGVMLRRAWILKEDVVDLADSAIYEVKKKAHVLSEHDLHAL